MTSKFETVGKKQKKPKVGIAEQLARLATMHYRFSRDDRGELFAVMRDGPNIAHMLKGSSDALRQRLGKLYRTETKRTPNAAALGDAMNVLAGEALDAEVEPVHLRLATHQGGIVIDLGDVQGRAVQVHPGGWKVLDRSPVLFRRTALTGQLPVPVHGGELAELTEIVNIGDDSWPLIIGWLVAALMPDIPHPVLMLNGLQGTGKSRAARTLISLIDPSAAPLRSEPRDAEQWAMAASGSWAFTIDNVSHITPWLSDAICKASTGDGLVKRKHYSDSDLIVLSFRRVIVLTTIDAGALRSDLGDRLLMVDLEPIPEGSRKTEAELDAALDEIRPRLFGAILTALSRVLAKLPQVRPLRLPRMADFGRVLAAADADDVTSNSQQLFANQQGRVAGEVIDADPFATAIVEFMAKDEFSESWEGTATELLSALLPAAKDDKVPQGWPKRNGVKGRLKRLIPALITQGIQVTFDREGRDRRRVIEIRKCLEKVVPIVRTVRSPENEEPSADDADDADDVFQQSSNGTYHGNGAKQSNDNWWDC